MEKTRITYRMDPDGGRHKEYQPYRTQKEDSNVVPLYEEEYRVVEEAQPLNQYTSDYGVWSSPFDEETRRIEQLIRESARPVQPHPRQQDPGDNRQYDVHPLAPGVSYEETRYIRRTNHSWIRLSTTVIGAIITGVLFGYFVISLFSNSKVDDTAADTTNAVGASQTEISSPSANPLPGADLSADAVAGTGTDVTSSLDVAATAAAANAAASQVSPVAAIIPSRSYSMLQSGKFSTLQSAETMQAALNSKGTSAVIEAGDDYFVYAGIAPNKSSAAQLNQQFKTNQIDIYIKSFALPAVARLNWNGKADVLVNYLKQSDKLVQMLSGITIVHLEQDPPSAIDNATIQALSAAHESWSTLTGAVAASAPDSSKISLQTMNHAMDTAKQSMDEYKKNLSITMLWQAQNNLMQFLIAEKAFLTAITLN